MKRTAHRWLPYAPALLLAGGLLAVGGCAKKMPSGPFGAYLVPYPEGTRDSLERTPSDLVVWPDVPLSVLETSTDSTVFPTRTFTIYRSAPGVLHGEIMDYVQASGYQLFRSEDGGGYRAFTDFSLSALRRWVDRTYYGGDLGQVVLPPSQVFLFSDAMPVPIPLKGYVGRAEVSRITGSPYPLTNLGATPDTAAIPPLPYTGRTGRPGTPEAPPDSLLAMSWTAIPGAAGYWVHIYQKRDDIRSSEDAMLIAQPAPIATGKVRDLFIGFFPAPITAYKLGDPVPPRSRVLVYRVLLSLQEVIIRVSAVDATGRMIATTGSAGDLDAVSERFGQTDRRRTFYLGANKVTPDRPKPPN
jgi:hypothetical protein